MSQTPVLKRDTGYSSYQVLVSVSFQYQITTETKRDNPGLDFVNPLNDGLMSPYKVEICCQPIPPHLLVHYGNSHCSFVSRSIIESLQFKDIFAAKNLEIFVFEPLLCEVNF